MWPKKIGPHQWSSVISCLSFYPLLWTLLDDMSFKFHMWYTLVKLINGFCLMIAPACMLPLVGTDINHLIGGMVLNLPKYSRLSLTQLCLTQYYHLSRPDGPVPIFSPIYYCNSTTFISTTAKSIKLITRYEKQVPLINNDNYSVFYNA